MTFEVIRGTATIASSGTTVTLTESSNYTLPAGADATNCFIRLTNARITGMGDTSGGGNQDNADFCVWITNPANIATSITFQRYDAPTFACRLTYEIICYTGTNPTLNEFVVRESGVLSGTNSASLSTSTISGIADDADVMVVITGQASDQGADNANWHGNLWTADWDSINDQADFTRLGGSLVSPQSQSISYAVIEWVGENWTVDRFETTTTGSNWASGNNTSFTVAHGVTVPDLAKAGIFQVQYATSNDSTGLDDAGDAVYLDSTSNVRIWNKSTSGTRRKVCWILQNSQASGTVRNLVVQHFEYQDDTTSGTEERLWTFNFTTDPDSGTGTTTTAPLDECSLHMSASVDGGGTAYPRGAIDYRMTGTNEVTFTESDAGQERRLAVELFEWPEEDAVVDTVMDADSGSYAWTGTAAGTYRDSVLAVDSGSWAWAGAAATLLYDSAVDADTGSYLWTGTDASLEFHSVIDATATAYSWSGQDVSLLLTFILLSQSGSYAWTGTAADLLHTGIIAADTTSYAWTVNDAGLVYSTRISAQATSYAWTGQPALLEFGALVSAQTASYAWSGQDVTFLRDVIIPANSASWAWTGTAAGLFPAFNLSATTTSYAWTGQTATLVFDSLIQAESAVYLWTGIDADLISTTSDTLAAGAANWIWSGTDAGFLYDQLLAGESGSYLWTGGDVTLGLRPAGGGTSYVGQVVNTGIFMDR